VAELRAERANLVNQLRHVDAALSVLGKLNGGSAYTKWKRISLAQKARWAKRAAKQTGKGKPKRTMSASARRKIAAAQRARWGKVKREKQNS